MNSKLTMPDESTIYPLIINSSGLQSNANNNTYRYSFPQGSVSFSKSRVAVANVNMYYSWYNITAANGNNEFQFIWPYSSTLYTLTLPDGFYDVSGLNTYIQQFCITNSLYLINATGNYVYYLELIENSNYYSVQFNSYSVPTSLPSGYTEPSGWPGYPATANGPQLWISANSFRSVIGFDAGIFPPAPQTATYSKLSTTTPQVTPIQSIILACSLLNNKYSNPSTILYSFTPGGTTFGDLIESSPNQYSFIDIQQGQYPYFDIQFLDQSFNAITLNDTNIVVQLLIKNLDV